MIRQPENHNFEIDWRNKNFFLVPLEKSIDWKKYSTVKVFSIATVFHEKPLPQCEKKDVKI
jgi:hypothetical protein